MCLVTTCTVGSSVLLPTSCPFRSLFLRQSLRPAQHRPQAHPSCTGDSISNKSCRHLFCALHFSFLLLTCPFFSSAPSLFSASKPMAPSHPAHGPRPILFDCLFAPEPIHISGLFLRLVARHPKAVIGPVYVSGLLCAEPRWKGGERLLWRWRSRTSVLDGVEPSCLLQQQRAVHVSWLFSPNSWS